MLLQQAAQRCRLLPRKLGIINKESDSLDQTAARTNAPPRRVNSYIPATSTYGGYQAYQPVTTGGGRLTLTRAKANTTSPAGWCCAGHQLDRQLRDAGTD